MRGGITPLTPLREKPIRKSSPLKCLSFLKNKWLSLFIDMVQKDFKSTEWSKNKKGNLTRDERQALNELREAENLIIKRSDKGGNPVLLNENDYEGEVRRQLRDQNMYEFKITHSLHW